MYGWYNNYYGGVAPHPNCTGCYSRGCPSGVSSSCYPMAPMPSCAPVVGEAFPLVPLEQNIPSGGWDWCTAGDCPPGKIAHWLLDKSDCRWPKPCLASCFEHNPTRDWVDIQPKILYGNYKVKPLDFIKNP